uniref:uncharacterized protein LOC101608505 isoform X4 n=1 Tax=Jaculus jaculus TaxID=51337 RepID=UPI001E1B1D09|nr:uncharacterized protein LOC101608505 isoform X4 [Jaculus jaculus]
MQPPEVGLLPAPAREPRLTRWLRRGSGILAHLVALGFTIFLTVLSRPGTSKCVGRGGPWEGAGPRGPLRWLVPGHQPVLFDSQVFSPGTLCSWPWRSASAWLKPSSSSHLSTPCFSSALERPGFASTGRGRL